MSHASGNNYDPSAWAKQRQERIKRASQLRLKRRSESPDENHTFKPHLVASTDGASSKLPHGARAARDAVALPRGTYDLTVLDTMEDAFPSNGTPHMIYRDVADVGRRQESLDRLDDISIPTPNRNDNRDSHTLTDAPRSLPSHDGGHTASRQNSYNRKPREVANVKEARLQRGNLGRDPRVSDSARSGFDSVNGLKAGRRSLGEDALSHEVQRRPNVRGSFREDPRDWSERDLLGTVASRRRDSYGTGEGIVYPAAMSLPDGNGRSVGHVVCGSNGKEAGTSDNEAFAWSISGEGGRCRRSQNGDSKRGARRQAKRPEWNSETAEAGPLSGPPGNLTDNSSAAVQRRTSASRNGSSKNHTTDCSSNNNFGEDSGNRRSSNGGYTRYTGSRNVDDDYHGYLYSNSAGETVLEDRHARAYSNSNSTAELAADLAAQEEDLECRKGRGSGERMTGLGSSRVPPTLSAGGHGHGHGHGAAGRGKREGYRSQMTPNPSRGSFKLHRGAVTGIGGVKWKSGPTGEEVAVDKHQLRRNLTLLKKKMHSAQTGTFADRRRSQSAGSRSGELSGDPDGADVIKAVDRRYPGYGGGHQHLHPPHTTSGTAPAVMSTMSKSTMPMSTTPISVMLEASCRDGFSMAREPRVDGQSRPPAEGPGSPYTVDSSSCTNVHRDLHRDAMERGLADHASRNGKILLVKRGSSHAAKASTTHGGQSESGSIELKGRGGFMSELGGDSSPRPRGRSVRRAVEDGAHKGRLDRQTGWAWGAGRGANREQATYAAVLPDDAYPTTEPELRECSVCGRRFNPQALVKHLRTCQSVFHAKRKVFDTSEMRTKGTEVEKFFKNKGRGKGRGQAAQKGLNHDDTPIGSKTSKWRQQSSQFRNAIRQARVVTNAQRAGKSLADLPPLEPSPPDLSLVQCPHCGRRFNETAGERHIRHCKNIKAKPSVLKKGSGSLLGHAARNRSSATGQGLRGQHW